MEAAGLPASKCDVYKTILGGGPWPPAAITAAITCPRQGVLIAKQMPGTPVKPIDLVAREEDA